MAYMDYVRLEQARWDLVGRAESPFPGDADEVAEMAAHYGILHDSFARMSGILNGLDAEDGLKGEWAKKLNEDLDSSMKGEFRQWASVFGVMRSELRSWAGQLQFYCPLAASYIKAAEDAQIDKDRIGWKVDAAQQEVNLRRRVSDSMVRDSQASQADKAKAKKDLESAQDDLSAYRKAVSTAEETIAEQKRLIDALACDYETDARRHANAIRSLDMPARLKGLDAFYYSAAWQFVSSALKIASVVLTIACFAFPGVGWLAALSAGVGVAQWMMSTVEHSKKDIGDAEYWTSTFFAFLSVVGGISTFKQITFTNPALRSPAIFSKGGKCEGLVDAFKGAYRSSRSTLHGLHIPDASAGKPTGIVDSMLAATKTTWKEHGDQVLKLMKEDSFIGRGRDMVNAVTRCRGAHGAKNILVTAWKGGLIGKASKFAGNFKDASIATAKTADTMRGGWHTNLAKDWAKAMVRSGLKWSGLEPSNSLIP